MNTIFFLVLIWTPSTGGDAIATRIDGPFESDAACVSAVKNQTDDSLFRALSNGVGAACVPVAARKEQS